MEKELTTLEVREKANTLLSNWETYKKEIHIAPKSLYNLINIKKQFEEQLRTINDTLVSMFESNECSLNEEGTGFTVPPEKVETVNQFMMDFSAQKVKFTYDEIKMKETDSVPAELIELFFDFIVFE